MVYNKHYTTEWTPAQRVIICLKCLRVFYNYSLLLDASHNHSNEYTLDTTFDDTMSIGQQFFVEMDCCTTAALITHTVRHFLPLL